MSGKQEEASTELWGTTWGDGDLQEDRQPEPH